MAIKIERLTTEQMVKLVDSVLDLEGVELGALRPEQTQILQAGAIIIAKAIIAERYTVATLMDKCTTYENILTAVAIELGHQPDYDFEGLMHAARQLSRYYTEVVRQPSAV